jgi:hypothetical protein
MKYVEAPDDWAGAGSEVGLFLAGGITGTTDWQAELVARLTASDLTLVNPRRKTGLEKTGEAARDQIRWEHRHMQRCDAISFWFPPETLCPITLFELGKWVGRPKPIFVGCDPSYPRQFDVEVQCGLERPGLVIVHSLDALAKQILEWKPWTTATPTSRR